MVTGNLLDVLTALHAKGVTHIDLHVQHVPLDTRFQAEPVKWDASGRTWEIGAHFEGELEHVGSATTRA